MLKLMKYEFRKQAASKGVILLLIGLIELLFFFGVIFSKEKILAISMGILVVFTYGSMFFMAFESIITYSNDLKNKCSYMLFLTPNTSYRIVGAKVAAAAIQIIVASLVFFGVFALNMAVLVAKFVALADFKTMCAKILQELFQLEINVPGVLSILALVTTVWICTITIAFFSITLSATFLANKKFKGFVSLIIFIIINVFYNYIADLIFGNRVEMNKYYAIIYSLQSLYILAFTVLTYLSTAWMLEKKVSV